MAQGSLYHAHLIYLCLKPEITERVKGLMANTISTNVLYTPVHSTTAACQSKCVTLLFAVIVVSKTKPSENVEQTIKRVLKIKLHLIETVACLCTSRKVHSYRVLFTVQWFYPLVREKMFPFSAPPLEERNSLAENNDHETLYKK